MAVKLKSELDRKEKEREAKVSARIKQVKEAGCAFANRVYARKVLPAIDARAREGKLSLVVVLWRDRVTPALRAEYWEKGKFLIQTTGALHAVGINNEDKNEKGAIFGEGAYKNLVELLTHDGYRAWYGLSPTYHLGIEWKL